MLDFFQTTFYCPLCRQSDSYEITEHQLKKSDPPVWIASQARGQYIEPWAILSFDCMRCENHVGAQLTWGENLGANEDLVSKHPQWYANKLKNSPNDKEESKMEWSSKVPTQAGFYLYDMGFGSKRGYSIILMHSDGDGTLIGVGTCPLSMIYSPKICTKARFAKLEIPQKWEEIKIPAHNTRAWVRSPNGYIGFGVLVPGWNYSFGGTIGWLNNPNVGIECGSWHNYDGFKFSLFNTPE